MINLVFHKEENSKAEHLCNEELVYIVLYYNVMQISRPFVYTLDTCKIVSKISWSKAMHTVKYKRNNVQNDNITKLKNLQTIKNR